jgi:hypothetical protein
VHDGLIGSFAIDADGDPTPTPITFVRIRNGNGDDLVASYEGAVFDRVITPSRRLLGKTG